MAFLCLCFFKNEARRGNRWPGEGSLKVKFAFSPIIVAKEEQICISEFIFVVVCNNHETNYF